MADGLELETELSTGTLEALRSHLAGAEGEGRAPRSPGPADSKRYNRQEYWNERFNNEESYDWLVNYADVAKHLRKLIPLDGRVLIVGCGNSSLSADMHADGFSDILSTDYSSVVIDAMRARQCGLGGSGSGGGSDGRPADGLGGGTRGGGLRWMQADMLDLAGAGLADGSFDAVVDKAAMDALMCDEGSVWDPEPAVVAQADRMCREVSRVLRPGGVFVQISFAQPHFRRKYLLGDHAVAAAAAAAAAAATSACTSATDVDGIARGEGDGAVAGGLSPGMSGGPCPQQGQGQHKEGYAEKEEEEEEEEEELARPCSGATASAVAMADGTGHTGKSGCSCGPKARRRWYGWDVESRDIVRDTGCLGYFMYVAKKGSACTCSTPT